MPAVPNAERSCGSPHRSRRPNPSSHRSSRTTQVSANNGVFYGVTDKTAGPTFTVLESVRCLECGAVYSKPAGGGTVRENPGCPECGYVGWVVAGVPFNEDALPHRSAAGPPQRPAY
jgi:hypothetical protein